MPPEYRFKGTARQLDGYPDHFSFLQGAPKLCSGPCQKTLSISFDKSSWTSWTHGLLREWDFGIFWLCSAKAWFSYPFTILYHLLSYSIDRPGDVHLKDCAQLFVKLLASERAQVMHWGAVMRHRMAEPLKPLPAVTAAEFKNYSVHYAVPSSLLAGV